MAAPVNLYVMNAQSADIGTAGTQVFAAVDHGWLRRVTITLNAAITVANEVVTVSVNGTALSPTITIPFTGSAAGTTVTQEFYAPVRRGDRITVANDGASTGVAAAAIAVVMQS